MRTIILEFIGGSWDGKNLSNDSMDAREIRLAVHNYLESDAGAIGKTVILPLDYATSFFMDANYQLTALTQSLGQVYTVTERTEIGENVLVRFEFSGTVA